jgi:hypothetical protein
MLDFNIVESHRCLDSRVSSRRGVALMPLQTSTEPLFLPTEIPKPIDDRVRAAHEASAGSHLKRAQALHLLIPHRRRADMMTE